MVGKVACKWIGRFFIVFGAGVTASCGPGAIKQMPPVAVAPFVPPTFHPGKVSEATWSDGTKLKVLCIAGESPTGLGWKVDGAPIQVRDVMRPNSSYSMSSPPGKRSAMVMCSLTGKRMDEAHASMMLPMMGIRLGGVIRSTVVGSPGWNPKAKYVELEQVFEVPAALSNADLEVGLGFGEFKPELRWPATPAILTVRVIESPGVSSTRNIHANGNGKRSSRPDGACNVECEAPESVLEKEWRVVLYGANGEEIPDSKCWSVSRSRVRPNYVHIGKAANVPPGAVKKVVIETRDYQWVKIPGLPIIPKVVGSVALVSKHLRFGKNASNL